MRSITLVSLLAGLSYALPQDGCSTTTKQIIVPTRTATYSSTAVVTEHPSTAKDLGTYTYLTTLSSTTTLETITATTHSCHETGIISIPHATETVWGTSTPKNRPEPHPVGSKRDLGLSPRDGCTVTVTSTTTFGQTHTYVAVGETSTYWDYTAFTQATVTKTKSGGRAYAIASATTTSETTCGSVTVTPTLLTTTVTMDERCAPTAMASAYNNYGIEWLSDVPAGGATYKTNATDASACCQLCAEAYECAASAWDIRTGICRLEFPVNWKTGDLNCGQGLLGYYQAGPNHPMSPGTGWYVAELCGNAQYGQAKPDDGT